MGGVAEELLDVRPDLGDHRGGGQHPDPGGGGQQVPLGAKGRHHRLDLRVQLRDHRIEVADMVQVQAAHQGMMVTEPALQRHGQVRDLGPHRALGQVRQHRGAAFPVDQRLDHRPPGLGGDGGGHRVDLDAGVLEHVAEPLHLRGPGLHDLGAVPDDVPGGLDARGRDEAAPQQPALQQVHQPLGVCKICFAARDVLDMPGVAHQHLGELPVLDQRMVDRHAVDPGGLHRHMGDPLGGKPPGRLPEHPIERLEGALDRLPAARSVAGQPDRHRDHVLADVNRRAPLIQNLHACQPPGFLERQKGHACRPRSP